MKRNSKRTFFIASNGCIRRKLEAQYVKIFLLKNGYSHTTNPKKADYLIFVSCAYDQANENVSKHTIEKMIKIKKDSAEVIIGGCLPVIQPNVLVKLNLENRVFTPISMDRINALFRDSRIPIEEINAPGKFDTDIADERALGIRQSRVIEMSTIVPLDYFVKNILHPDDAYHHFKNHSYILYVARGCLSACAYCAIRNATHPFLSRDIRSIVNECKIEYQNGERKFTITSEDTSAYGKNLGTNIVKLLRHLLAVSPQIEFIITGLNPTWILPLKNQIIQIFAQTDQIKHVVVPIQAVSDALLASMRRIYSVQDIDGLFAEFQKHCPHIQFHTHVIIGYPNETENDIKRLKQFIKKYPNVNYKLFKYSDRVGTEASKLPNHIPANIINRRFQDVAKIIRELRHL